MRRSSPAVLWRLALPTVALGAGVLFATSAETASGTDLRAGRQLLLQQLIQRRAASVQAKEETSAELRRGLDATTRERARTDARLVGPQHAIDELQQPTGLTAVRGPAITVRLDDAPRSTDGSLPVGAAPDDVVVHQQDVQAVVNALWAGGAEAMTVMGVRVISTSAVRCVGNTLLLHGRTYSPPFLISAVGETASLQRALDQSPGVLLFRQAARDWGLGYKVTTVRAATLPAYDGSISMTHARPLSLSSGD
jgi:uncharacterized protein YlxW (UPF0749 family)